MHFTPLNLFRNFLVFTSFAGLVSSTALPQPCFDFSQAEDGQVDEIEYVNVNTTVFAPASFVHPGVLIDKNGLDFVRNKVNSGEKPWSSAFTSMLSSDLASLSRTPKPRENVECGAYSNPDHGCRDERQDALAAYAMALAWYIKRDEKYAKKAISYFNAWAPVIKKHTALNAPLQTGWSGTSWARGAEIIRHTYGGWASSDVSKFENMLRNVYLPQIIGGSQSNGNWELVMVEAAQAIAVFLNDASSYDKAMTKYMGRVPAYVYLESDGEYPKAAPGSGLNTKEKIIKYWQGQNKFINGIAQETCRDFVHTGYGIASIGHVAETSRIQGNDLFKGDVGTRLRHALGFHSLYELGTAPPSWLCGGKVNRGLGPVTEVGYNAMHTRLGFGMANTEKLTLKQRPAGSNYLFLGWETLTHAGDPDAPHTLDIMELLGGLETFEQHNPGMQAVLDSPSFLHRLTTRIIVFFIG